MLGHSLGDFLSGESRTSNFLGRGGRSNRAPTSDRLAWLRLVVIAAFLILLANLVRVQIFAGEYYRDLANGNRVREILVRAPRGIIFDRFGVPLTANLPAFRLLNCKDKEKTQCEGEVISKDQAIALEAQGTLKDNQTIEVDSTRSYLKSLAFAHLLGYVSEVSDSELKTDGLYHLGDKIGRGGIEEKYDSQLRGINGKELIEVDAMGRKLKTLATVDPKPGTNLNLTIDAALQQTAFDALNGKTGAVIATDPTNGEILALVSSPSFDPNLFTDSSLQASDRQREINGLFTDDKQPLFNRAISGTYPPGSTFKLVMATAGLETGAIKSDTLIEDTGELVIGPYKFANWKWLSSGGVEGNLNVVGGIQKSNDIFFYNVGGRMGIDTMMDWAKKFGLGSKLGIDLPGEASGLVPDSKWRDANARSWYLGDTYHVAIGQGDLLVTPLQDNAWTNVMANGGNLCRPHLLSDNSDASTYCKSLGIKPDTLDLVRQGMTAACSPGGTAYPLFGFKVNGKEIPLACKTGTAEYGSQDRLHAWFTVFGPATGRPTISVTVLVEGGGEGSDVAAPIAKKVLEKWFSK